LNISRFVICHLKLVFLDQVGILYLYLERVEVEEKKADSVSQNKNIKLSTILEAYLVEKVLSQLKAGFYDILIDIKFPLTTSVLVIAKSLWNYILLIVEDSKSGKKSEFAAKTSITKDKNSIEDFLKKRE
jgi:hypothetical protein